MEREIIMLLAAVVIAFSTFVGVLGDTAYYMKEIQNLSIQSITPIE